MIALVDCNSFFCSVEKVFHPGLEGKPMCVLSSNDGCIIALTPEAKRIGLHRGDPLFKVRNIVEQHQVTIFSTNMQLYAAMSRRVNNILRAAVPHTEMYSIDESFLYLDGLGTYYNPEEYMRNLSEKVKLYTDIPVSIGIAPTKTLAKLGSKFAKLYSGYRGVCMIDCEDKRRKALARAELNEVWGIGKHTLQKLYSLGIESPLQLADKKESWVRNYFTKPVIQTWKELNGISCIDTHEVAHRQSICTSRSFGRRVTDYDSLRASVAHFAAGCANKLRGQHSLAGAVSVFVSTSRFRQDQPQYSDEQTTLLPIPSCDTAEITQAALQALRHIYRKDICYKKAGVVLSNISNGACFQQHLFDPVRNRAQRIELMRQIDTLNRRFGLKKVHLAIEDCPTQEWHPQSAYRSGNYLSDLDGILTIQI